eukprot:6205496-Pleurochrysis_carterae.AAC.1
MISIQRSSCTSAAALNTQRKANEEDLLAVCPRPAARGTCSALHDAFRAEEQVAVAVVRDLLLLRSAAQGRGPGTTRDL